MKDKELHDIFHSYHPEMSSDEDFMARLNEQMNAIDAQNASPAKISIYRRILPWVASIAAVVAVGMFLFKPTKGTEPQVVDIYPAYPERTALVTMNTDPLASFEETVAEIERSGQQLQLAIAEIKK